jgi:hypothetical protein
MPAFTTSNFAPFGQSSGQVSADVDDSIEFKEGVPLPPDFWFNRQRSFTKITPPHDRDYVESVEYGCLKDGKTIAIGDTFELKKKPGFQDAEFLHVNRLRRDRQGILWVTGHRFVRAKYFPVGISQMNELVMFVQRKLNSDGTTRTQSHTVSEKELSKPRELIRTGDCYPHHNPVEQLLQAECMKTGGDPMSCKRWLRASGTLICRMQFEILLTGSSATACAMKKEFSIRHLGVEAEPSYDQGLRPNTWIPLCLERINSTDRVTYVDGCAGGGGSVTGAKLAGAKVLAAFDHNERACETLVANHPDIAIYHGCQSDVARGLTVLNYDQHLDILHLSCPCQYYARCKTVPGANDEQNRALTFCVRQHLRHFSPLILTMEQTTGIIIESQHQPDLFCLISDIVTEGYNVRFKVADMREGGLGARRDRLITIASR